MYLNRQATVYIAWLQGLKPSATDIGLKIPGVNIRNLVWVTAHTFKLVDKMGIEPTDISLQKKLATLARLALRNDELYKYASLK